MNAQLANWDDLRVFLAVARAGEETLGIVERIEADVATLDREVTRQDLRLGGTVRITATDMLAFWLLPDHLRRFRDVHPGIEVEIIVNNEALNLSRQETGIAPRIGNTPPETLVGTAERSHAPPPLNLVSASAQSPGQ